MSLADAQMATASLEVLWRLEGRDEVNDHWGDRSVAVGVEWSCAVVLSGER